MYFYILPLVYLLSQTLTHVSSLSSIETPVANVTGQVGEHQRRSYKGYSVLRLTPTSNDQLDFLRSLELKDPEVREWQSDDISLTRDSPSSSSSLPPH